MRLPNANLALVERPKITEYLLNREHPDNGGKADFFIALGFHVNDWETMAAALRMLAIDSPVTLSVESPHGKKYIVDGTIENAGWEDADGSNRLDHRYWRSSSAAGDGISIRGIS